MEIRARYILVGLFTLAVIAAGFGFVYWLNNSGGLGNRSVYRIRFESTVSGLQVGAAVRFNGIRVGEVTGLQLDVNDPRQVTALIAIDRGTPLRADTKIGMDFQGLMGMPAISLSGGTPAAPLLVGSEADPPIIAADPDAVQDLAQTARQALQRVDKILSDNSQSLKSTIDNLKTFSEALARNSDHIDGIMTGLEHLAGGGASEKPKPIYDLAVPSSFPPSNGALRGQLVVTEPTAVVALETQRMLSRTSEGRIETLGDAQWSDMLPKLIQAKIIQSFENAGYSAEVLPPVERATVNYQLILDLRSFYVLTNPEMVADVEFSAKIVADNGRVISARLFHATALAKEKEASAVAAALNQAFGKAVADLVAWTSGLV